MTIVLFIFHHPVLNDFSRDSQFFIASRYRMNYPAASLQFQVNTIAWSCAAGRRA
jgi:hypothetical protein